LFCVSFSSTTSTWGRPGRSCADVGERFTGHLERGHEHDGEFGRAAGGMLAGSLLQAAKRNSSFLLFAGSYALASLSWLLVDVSKPLA